MEFYKYAHCDTCPLNFRHVVPPVNLVEPKIKKAKYLLVGEAPGRIELLEKEYFVGLSGQTLKQAMHIAGLSEDDVVFANACMCRPLSNDTPTPQAIKSCQPALQKVIDLVEPERILLLGATARKSVGFKGLEGFWDFDTLGVPTMSCLHPSAIARAPEQYINFLRTLIKFGRSSLTWNPPEGYDLIDTPEQLKTYLDKTKKCSFDIETGRGVERFDNLVLTASMYCDADERPIVLSKKLWRNPAIIDILNNAETTFVGSNIINFDADILYHLYGIKLKDVEDTLHKDYCLYEAESGDGAIISRGLKHLSALLLNAPDYASEVRGSLKEAGTITDNVLYKYVALDAYCSWGVNCKLEDSFNERNHELYNNYLKPFAVHLMNASQDGILIDTKYLSEFGDKLQTEIESLKTALPGVVNIGSPKQLAKFLFEDLKLPRIQKDSTDKSVLAELHRMFPNNQYLNTILEYRTLTKFHSTYVKGILEGSNGEWAHPLFNVGGTNTGRPSSKSFNIQNIPVRDKNELGEDFAFPSIAKEILRAFIVPDEYTGFFGVDYSQLEVRVLAVVSGATQLQEIIRSGADIHSEAGKLYYPDWDDISPEERKIRRTRIKNAVFGSAYGLTEQNAGNKLGISKEEGVRIVRAINQTIFPELGAWIARTHRQALEDRLVPYWNSPRVRHFPIITDLIKAKVLRQAVNSQIQGTGSDFCMMSFCDSRSRGVSTRFPLHDALYGYYKHIDEVKIVCDCMTGQKFELPLEVEAKIGPNWADMKVIKL